MKNKEWWKTHLVSFWIDSKPRKCGWLSYKSEISN